MFWEPQNSSLHHEGGEILLPMVAESEYTNCNYCHHMLNFVIYRDFQIEVQHSAVILKP